MLEKFKGTLGHKYGPFPLWAWGIGGAAAIVIGLRIARWSGKGGASTSSISEPQRIPAMVGSGGDSVTKPAAPQSASTYTPPPVPNFIILNQLPRPAGSQSAPQQAGSTAPPGSIPTQTPTPSQGVALTPSQGVAKITSPFTAIINGIPFGFVKPAPQVISTLAPNQVLPGAPASYGPGGGAPTARPGGYTAPALAPTPQVQPSRPYIYTQEQAIANARQVAAGTYSGPAIETTQPTSGMAAFLNKFGYKG